MTVVNLDLVKRHLTMDKETNDDRLTLILDAALEIVADIVGPLSGSASGRVTSDGNVLVLPSIPVVGVTSIASVIDPDTPLDLADYTVDLANGFVYGVPCGTYTVVYDAGWDTVGGAPDLPADMASGVIELIRKLFGVYRGPTRSGDPGVSVQQVYDWAADRFSRYRTVKVA